MNRVVIEVPSDDYQEFTRIWEHTHALLDGMYGDHSKVCLVVATGLDVQPYALAFGIVGSPDELVSVRIREHSCYSYCRATYRRGSSFSQYKMIFIFKSDHDAVQFKLSL